MESIEFDQQKLNLNINNHSTPKRKAGLKKVVGVHMNL